jgi:hypothetical protein
MSFIATQNKGFSLKFENGFSISVQWGTMNYCEKKNIGTEYGYEMKKPTWESTSAEIAVFKGSDSTHPGGSEIIEIGEHDTVIGWLSADQVAKVIAIVSSSTTENEIKSKIKSLNIS